MSWLVVVTSPSGRSTVVTHEETPAQSGSPLAGLLESEAFVIVSLTTKLGQNVTYTKVEQ